MNFIFLIVGLVLLVKGADWLVTGASSIAKRFGVSSIVIGLTIVAFGTSAPEFVVNLVSVFQDNTQLAIGNVIGSNIANILFILGVAAVIYPLRVKSNTVWKEVPFALLAALVSAALVNDALIDGAPLSVLSRIDGVVLLSFFVVFLYYTQSILMSKEAHEEGHTKLISASRGVFFVIIGFVGLVVGGKVFVDAAILIAQSFGLSEAFIGLTVVAVGTSLPELFTSAIAAFRKETDIAIGNVVGSNIFNTFGVLGVSSLVKPLPLVPANNVDFIVSIGAALVLFLALFIGKRHLLERWQGFVFIGLYVSYIAWLSWGQI